MADTVFVRAWNDRTHLETRAARSRQQRRGVRPALAAHLDPDPRDAPDVCGVDELGRHIGEIPARRANPAALLLPWPARAAYP
jgi:hypothetical protein